MLTSCDGAVSPYGFVYWLSFCLLRVLRRQELRLPLQLCVTCAPAAHFVCGAAVKADESAPAMVLGGLLQAFGGCCCFCVCYTMSTAVAFAIYQLPLCVCYRCYCLFATISAAAKVRRILCVPSASCTRCGIGGAFGLRSSCLRHYSCIGSAIRAFMFRCVLLQLLVHAVVPMLLVLLFLPCAPLLPPVRVLRWEGILP